MSNFATQVLTCSYAAAIAIVFSPVAWAGESYWDHNGSLVKMIAQVALKVGADVERIKAAVGEVARSTPSISKLSVAASLVGDLVKH